MKKIQQTFAVVYDDGANTAFKVNALIQQALAHHQGGRIGEAAKIYERVLSIRPDSADALNLLGVIALQNGDVDQAISLSESAIKAAPQHASALSNLGNARLAKGNLEGAVQAFQSSLNSVPGNPDVHYNLANAFRCMGWTDRAITEFRLALQLNPALSNGWLNLGNLYASMDRHEDAVSCFKRVVNLAPATPNLYSNYGISLAKLNRLEEAEKCIRIAVDQFPNDSKSVNNLGSVLIRQGNCSAAVAILRRAVELVPDDVVCRNNLAHSLIEGSPKEAKSIVLDTLKLNENCAWTWWVLGVVEMQIGGAKVAAEAFDKALALDPNLVGEANGPGLAYNQCSRIDDAIAFYEKALKLRPTDAEAWADASYAYVSAGNLAQSIKCLRESLLHNPENEFVHSNLLMVQCYSSEYSAEQLFDEAKQWAEIHTPAALTGPFISRLRTKKLRIGYVSPDFHDHPAGRIYQALFRYHNRDKFDVTIYANLLEADEVTQKIVESSDRWRLVRKLSDADFAKQVQEDQIDILVDLVGHTPNHRLKMFGLKPAPVQATWLGYFATTGMSQMDFILADRHVIPKEHEPYFTERPAIMPGTFYVYQPPDFPVEVSPLPALERGYVTFGCFNNTAKITSEVVALWCRVMHAVPHSRMLLNRWPFSSQTVRKNYMDLFKANGIDSSRIEIRSTYDRKSYYQSYQDVDIMLDSFPFGASTTTTEALWMGVPVVCLTSDRFAGRMSESVMRTVGVKELPTSDHESYLKLAVELATNLPYLADLRSTLRAQTENSPLCDFPSYARDLEATYEWMWDNRATNQFADVAA